MGNAITVGEFNVYASFVGSIHVLVQGHEDKIHKACNAHGQRDGHAGAVGKVDASKADTDVVRKKTPNPEISVKALIEEGRD